MRFPLICTLSFLVPVFATAHSGDPSAPKPPTGWLKLIHYEANARSPTGFRSAIHSADFFLSESGTTDPQAELQATLEAMILPLSEDADAHAKCRFPARLMWLREHFPKHREALADINCPALSNWLQIQTIDSISLVFANGYLGNPASYYGHLFLKFNDTSGSGNALTDQTANFGAIETRNDDPLSYIVKGILGGYDGGFSPVDFFFHEANYGENELRDLWEYRLSLSQTEVRYVTAHAWEILHKRFTYFFFHDNCAYRIGELLEIVEGLQANPRHHPWIIPQAVLQQISRSSHHGQPLVARRVFHPSRQTRLYQRFAALNATQRTLVSDLVEKRIGFDDPEMQERSLRERHGIIDTVLDYQSFKHDGKKQRGEKTLSRDYVDALNARLRLPPGMVESATEKPDAPDTANAPSWTQAGISRFASDHAQFSLRIRPAYYDPLDVSSAQAKNGGLSMGEIHLEGDERHLRLVRLNLMAIDSMNPAVTGLPGDRGFGWRLNAGMEEDRVGCTHCVTPRIQGDFTAGTWMGSPKVFGSASIGGAFQAHTETNGIGFMRAGLGIVARPSSDLGARIRHEFRRPVDSRIPGYFVSIFESRLTLTNGYDVRVLWERDKASRFTIGLGRYW